jgi:hypothetical protein
MTLSGFARAVHTQPTSALEQAPGKRDIGAAQDERISMIDVFGGQVGGYGAQGKFHVDPVTGALVPVVVESTSRGERSFDIFSRCCANGSCS